MLIYVDPQSYTNPYIKLLAIDKLPSYVEVTSDLSKISEIDIYIAGFGRLTKEMIDKAINLKSIIRNAVGTDNIDVDYAKEKNIPVYNLPLINYESVAEMTVGYMIACGRYMVMNHLNNINHIEKNYYTDYQGVELFGKTFGIIGFGRIGKRVAEIVKVAFNGRVLIYDPFVTNEQAVELGVEKFEDYRELMKKADFVSLHVPLTEETKDMINKDTLSLCQERCILINAARSGIVNETDLYDALKNKTIFASACDVLDDYNDNPLFSLPNFIGTSHICGNTKEARIRVGEYLYERLTSEIKRINQ